MFKEFVKRNSPLFYIGIFIAVVFLFIIILGQATPNITPNLQPVDEKELVYDTNPILGFKESRVTIVEFLDYNCPSCKALAPSIKNILEGNKNKVRVVVRNFPLVNVSGHESSYLAAKAVQTANKLGKFEDMHYGLLEAKDITKDSILALAEKAGLNKDEFNKIMESEEIKQQVDKDIEATQKFGVTGTPTIFLNGKKIDLQRQDLNTIIIAEINKMYPQN